MQDHEKPVLELSTAVVERIAWYLFPRVCPILSLSDEDLTRCIESYGRENTLKVLASLICENYDFPYARSEYPITPPPSSLPYPRTQCKPKPANPASLIGTYRCTRIQPDLRIPGITLLMQDSPSSIDWIYDCFMEKHRMKCWVAIQGKLRRWIDSRNDYRCPYIRATHEETLFKVLDADLVIDQKKKAYPLLNHDSLRKLVIGNSEATPPNLELYLQTIDKLIPSSISIPYCEYGVGIAALACVSGNIRCKYSLQGLEGPVAESIRRFVRTSGRLMEEVDEMSLDTGVLDDLIFIEASPYGTHDLRPYLGEKKSPKYLSYPEHLRSLLTPFINIAKNTSNTSPIKIALVISLRELPSQPTIEPLLLSILSNTELCHRLELVGSLVSQNRDYAVYLLRMQPPGRTFPEKQREIWDKCLRDNYPELFGIPTITKTQVNPSSKNDLCLDIDKIKKLDPDKLRIAKQGPRRFRGKTCFPLRTRRCKIISETTNLETGDVIFVFGEVCEPEEIQIDIPEEKPKTHQDPFLAKMLAGIRENMKASEASSG